MPEFTGKDPAAQEAAYRAAALGGRGAPMATRNERGSITTTQWQRLCALYLSLPIQTKMIAISELAGRDVDNLADLSQAEADMVIGKLESL